MTNRREFLQIGVTATAWPLVARVAHAADIEPPLPGTRILAVVYDTRFAESLAFARRSEALALKTLAIDNGDMTRVWFEEISPRWRANPAGLAGFTAHGPMFCFAELARDVGMRVVFRAEHRMAPSGVAHAFTGPAPMVTGALEACVRRDRSAPRWPTSSRSARAGPSGSRRPR